MRKIKAVMRLKLDARLSHERIAAALGISKGIVTKYVGLTSAAGLDWSYIQPLDETVLQHSLRAPPPWHQHFLHPDYAQIHKELLPKGMTLMLLWRRHTQQHPDGHTHSNSQFCENYRRYVKILKRLMKKLPFSTERQFCSGSGRSTSPGVLKQSGTMRSFT